jgi:DNA-binding protein HU-beta
MSAICTTGGIINMNKSQFIEKYAVEMKVTKKEAEVAFNAFEKVVKDTLKSGEDIKIIGFTEWTVKEKPEHEGRNPRTKETITVPAKTVAKAKVSQAILK